MSEVASAREVPLPRWVPALLSFVAGYVDIYTFLALFGLFVAQVTGSFVTAGAELVTHDIGITGKVIAIVAFLSAAALTAGLIGVLREGGRATLPWMLAFETVLLSVFTVALLAEAPVTNAGDWRGIPQTNVMTGNMTQLGIETTALWLAWRRYVRDPADADSAEEFVAVRGRLIIVLAIAIGFILGAVCGALAYATANLSGAPVAVVLVGALTLWAVWQERRA